MKKSVEYPVVVGNSDIDVNFEPLAPIVITVEDYDKFVFIRGNRPVSWPHVTIIINSMMVNVLPKPILVCMTYDKKFAILDGQHSFMARKQLEIDVPYLLMASDTDAMKRLNIGSKNWKGIDYARDFDERGLKDYETYLWFRNKYKFAHAQTLRLLSENKNNNYSELSVWFNDGRFRVVDLAKAIDHADKIVELEQYYKGARRLHFVNAMCYLFDLPLFSYDRFKRKMMFKSTELVDCANMDQYIILIEKMYNYQESKSNKVRLQRL